MPEIRAHINNSILIFNGKPLNEKKAAAKKITQIPLNAEKHCELLLVWVRIFQKEWNKLEIRIRKILLVAKI